MYPQRELARLATYKVWLRRGIALRRIECAGAAARIARPIGWLDRLLAFWRQLSPVVRVTALPLGVLLTRTMFPKVKFLGALLRWGPLVYGVVRQFAGNRAPPRDE